MVGRATEQRSAVREEDLHSRVRHLLAVELGVDRGRLRSSRRRDIRESRIILLLKELLLGRVEAEVRA